VRSMVPHASGAEQGKLFSWQDPLLVSGVSHCIDAKTDTSPPYVSISTQQLLPHVEYIELGPEPHMHVTAIGASQTTSRPQDHKHHTNRHTCLQPFMPRALYPFRPRTCCLKSLLMTSCWHTRSA
jgi:hypothetical protein